MSRLGTLPGAVVLFLTGALAVPGLTALAGSADPTTSSTTSTSTPATTTTVPESTTTTTTTVPESTTTVATMSSTSTTTTTTTGVAPAVGGTPTTTAPCAPPTTTTTTTTVPGATDTTTTTTTTLPPCPSTTTSTVPPTTTTTTTMVPTAPVALGIPVPEHMGDILQTIRVIESSERYDITPNKGNASGAYQYIPSTWNNFGGYPHAYLAPSNVQDERALLDVQAILERWKGDVSMVPVIWYYPRAATIPALMDEVPLPEAGNRLTVREYQHRWLDMLSFITGNPAMYRLAALPPELRFLAGLPPAIEIAQAPLDEIAFPVLGRAVVAPPAPCSDAECGSGTSAIVYGQSLQPILAAADGIVTAVELGEPVTGEVSVTLTDRVGRVYHYAGFNDDSPGTDDGDAHHSYRFTALAQVGTSVFAGQVLGFMGNTDPMPSEERRGTGEELIWPHLRLTIHDQHGSAIDADALVVAAQQRLACHVAIGPWSVPSDPRLSGLDRDEVEVSAIINGGFTLHADGTVTAHGRSALILAPQDCVWAPVEAFGPGASGSEPPDDWGAPFKIPAEHWVTGMLGDTGVGPAALLRRG